MCVENTSQMNRYKTSRRTNKPLPATSTCQCACFSTVALTNSLAAAAAAAVSNYVTVQDSLGYRPGPENIVSHKQWLRHTAYWMLHHSRRWSPSNLSTIQVDGAMMAARVVAIVRRVDPSQQVDVRWDGSTPQRATKKIRKNMLNVIKDGILIRVWYSSSSS